MKVIEVLTDAGHVDTILSIAEQYNLPDVWHYEAGAGDERQVVRLLVSSEDTQAVLDSAQKVLGSGIYRVIVLPVEATIPRYEDKQKVSKKTKISTSRSLGGSAFRRADNARRNAGAFLMSARFATRKSVSGSALRRFGVSMLPGARSGGIAMSRR